MLREQDPPTTACGRTLWLTGLSGAGKSTLARTLQQIFEAEGLRTTVLDGDEIRSAISADLGFSDRDRLENARRIGELALSASLAGDLTIVASISPLAAGRDAVRRQHAAAGVEFSEIFVDAPLSVCESRDPKGLYLAARAGSISRFTGISSRYEKPTSPELVVSTDGPDPVACAQVVLDHLGQQRELSLARRVRHGRIEIESPSSSTTSAVRRRT